MTPFASALVLVALAALGLPRVACADDEPGSKTPAEFFELYRGCYDSAAKTFSYSKLYDISSRDSQVLFFLRASQVAGMATRGPGFKVDESKVAKLNALLSKHGLDPAQKPLEGGPDMTPELGQKLFRNPSLLVAHLEKLLAPVKDKGRLIKDLFAFGRTAKPQPAPIEVKDLKAYKGHASGKLVEELQRGRETMTTTSPYCLVREKGRWVYDLVAIQRQMFSKR